MESESTHAESERLPDAVVEGLRRTDRALSIIDARIDQAVLARAREQFAGRPERRTSVRRRRLQIAAAAAVVAAALLIARPLDLWRPYGGPDDIDRSGRVDILDAFALARMRVAGEPVTQDEIDRLAARIVSLDSTRRTP